MKKYIKYIACIMFFLGIILIPKNSIKAGTITTGIQGEDSMYYLPEVARSYYGYAWYDSASGLYYFQVDNKERISSTYYESVGYEFSRMIDGTTYWTDAAGNRQSVAVKLGFFDTTYIYYYTDSSGTAKSLYTYCLSAEELREIISKCYPDWFTEISTINNTGGNAYIGVDADLVLHTKDKISGSILVRNNTLIAAGTVYRHENYEKLCDGTIGWASFDKTVAGIRSHYNIILPAPPNRTMPPTTMAPPANTPGSPDTPLEDVPDVPTNTSTCMYISKDYSTPTSNPEDLVSNNSTTSSGMDFSSPYTYTYNTSSEFDLGDAIPTTEGYTNGIDIASWYGQAKITYNTSHYAVTPTCIIGYTTTEYMYPANWKSDSNDAGVTWTEGDLTFTQLPGGYDATTGMYYGQVQCAYKVYHSTYVKTNYIFSGSYYALASINVLQAENATVTNDSVGTWSYSLNPDIQYDVRVAGYGEAHSSDHSVMETTAYLTSYETTEDPHITLPEIAPEDMEFRIELGEPDNVPSDAEMLQMAKDEAANRMQKYNDGTLQTTNDVLSLNGVNYIGDSGISIPYEESSIYYIGREANDHSKGEQDVVIPEDKANGYYYTKLDTLYRYFAVSPTVDTREYSIEDSESSNNAILPLPDVNDTTRLYTANEPIHVKSPVISPITIHGETATQAKQSEYVGAQLILDNTYKFSFDWGEFFAHKGYDSPVGWTEYVKDKWVRFPFTVKVKDSDDITKIYEPYSSTPAAHGAYLNDNTSKQTAPTDVGYTAWISVGDVTSFNFYIPSWAEEGIYGSGDATDMTSYNYIGKRIEVKCFANNYSDVMYQTGSSYAYNNTDGNYSAVFDYPVQISGVIYDFSVMGVNDEPTFGGIDYSIGCWQFTQHLQDKKVGYNNRFGNPAQRLFWSGGVVNPWELVNTLPLTNGKSNVYSDMGYLTKGSKISYSVRTISGLNGTADTIKIKPTYRYISADGTVYEVDQFTLYYSDNEIEYAPMGGTQDSNNKKSVSLGSSWFDMDLYPYRSYDYNAYTANKYGKTLQDLLFSNINSYTLGGITLTSSQKLLCGDEEQLKINQYNSSDSAIRYKTTDNPSGHLDSLSSAQNEKFKDSMQIWFGEYEIPNKIFVALKTNSGTSDKFKDAVENGEVVSEGSSCWESGGYLVLNFQIDAYKNGTNKHLTYYANTADIKWLNMWDREQGAVPTTTTATSGSSKCTITLRDGDVAVINMSRQASQQLETGTLYIN